MAGNFGQARHFIPAIVTGPLLCMLRKKATRPPTIPTLPGHITTSTIYLVQMINGYAQRMEMDPGYLPGVLMIAKLQKVFMKAEHANTPGFTMIFRA